MNVTIHLFLPSTLWIALVMAGPAHAQQCTINVDAIDRGERAAVLICGAELSSDYVLDGLSGSGISASYEQFLRRCDVEVKDRGLYLVLNADQTAQPTSLTIRDADSGAPLCNEMAIAVPERLLVESAALESLVPEEGLFRLKIKVNEPMDLSGACDAGLSFPMGKGPPLTLISPDEAASLPEAFNQPLTCTPSTLTALVRTKGQQRYPAKVVVAGVTGRSGEMSEAVSYVTLPTPQWASSMPQEDAKYVDVDGIRTRYFEKGEGPALILVHGGQPSAAGSNAWSWKVNFDDLSKHFQVFALDRLGQGYTDNPKTKQDFENYYQGVSDHLYGFIEALDLDDVSLVGQSQGGLPVTRVALDHPDQISCLINVDTTMIAPLDDPQMRGAKFYMYIAGFLHPKEGATIESLHRGSELYSHTLNNLSEEKAHTTLAISRLPKFIEAAKTINELGLNPLHPDVQAIRDDLLADMASGQLEVPTLIVWGHNDPEGSFNSGFNLFNLLSEAGSPAAFHVFANAGHQPFTEYPNEFNRLVLSFCGSPI
jgi:2-hydroxy-6-oxonona-2,4-dienedioate hydrolase